MITEYLMKPGAFAFRLLPSAPYAVLNAVREFDHLVVTPTWLDPTAISDLTILANAIYSGPITGKPTPHSFEGASWNWWLGTDDGLGAIYETPVANSTATTLSTWIGQLRPNSVGAGSVTDTGTNLAYSYQWATPREALDHLCRCVGAEWRVNPNGNLDAAAPATLHANYTTPKVVFANKPEGREGSYVGFNIVNSNKSRDINGYATRVVVAGKAGDGAVVATGAANGAAVYNNPRGFAVALTRLVNAPDVPAANTSAYATNVLGMFSSLRRSITIQTKGYAAPINVKCGDSIYIYDPRAYLSDSANQIQWRGEIIFPLKLRCLGYTWPLQRGMGVYARTSAGAYTDLTRFVQWEDDQPTTWQIGTSWGDPNQDPSQMGSAAYLGVNAAIVDRTTAIGQRSVVTLTADSVNNNAVANSLQNMTPNVLSFPILANKRYAFRAFATYDAAATTTGSRWTIYCATGTPNYRSEYALTATSRTFNEGLTTYQSPAASNATSAATTGNTALVEGVITAGASNDTVYFQFASEVASSAITAKANKTYIEWWQIP